MEEDGNSSYPPTPLNASINKIAECCTADGEHFQYFLMHKSDAMLFNIHAPYYNYTSEWTFTAGIAVFYKF